MAKTTLGEAARATAKTIRPIEAASTPAPVPAPAPAPTTTPRRSTGPKWEDTNRRTNVWMPVGMPERVRAELARRGDGRTMSALVVNLLNGWLETPTP